ncbi:MAG: hypothetical protein ACP5GG_05635 [Conexivisphaera sp.]
MNIRSGFFLIILILLLAAPALFVHASGPNGVILRMNVNEIYIENETAPVEVQATYFQNGIPQSGTVEITATITNASSGAPVDHETYEVASGIPQYIDLPSLPQGFYEIQAIASDNNAQSLEFVTQYLVAPPPVPYSAVWVNGGLFEFHSLMLN